MSFKGLMEDSILRTFLDTMTFTGPGGGGSEGKGEEESSEEGSGEVPPVIGSFLPEAESSCEIDSETIKVHVCGGPILPPPQMRSRVVVVDTMNADEFSEVCSRLFQDGYEMSSSSCGVLQSEAHDFASSYQAIMVLKDDKLKADDEDTTLTEIKRGIETEAAAEAETAAKAVEAMLKTEEPALSPEIAKPQEYLERKMFEKEQARWLRGEYADADMNCLLKMIIKHVLAQCIHYATCAEITERFGGGKKSELAKLLAKLPEDEKEKGDLIDEVVGKAQYNSVRTFDCWYRTSGASHMAAHTAQIVRRYIRAGVVAGVMGFVDALTANNEEMK